MASPVFVGRRAELAVLEAAASTERTTAVFVAGEAGAGKSRLVAEFTAAAATTGARVLTGTCVALGAENLPFAPFMGVLEAVAAELGPDGIEALVGPGRVDLARLVPDLGRPGDDHRPSGVAERAVLFQAVLRTLEGYSAERRLIVVIEDLHWADASSRELLSFLLGRLRGVLVVATYRNDEVHRRHPLRPLLADAARSERVARIDLAPLSADEVTQQLQAITGSALPPSVVEAVVARAEGNPFFAEELLAAGGGAELPPDLAEVLSARLSALPETARELVGLAAVAGPRVGHELLVAAAAGFGADIGPALREAVSHQVLVVEPDGTYAFRHALLAEAAYAELLPGERATLHATYAAALAAHPEWATTRGGVAGELAHHWLAARDRDRALGASVAAAVAAEETYAFAEAHHLYEQALALWEQVPDPSALAGCDRAQLLQRAADAAVLAGETKRAIALVRGALDELAASPQPARAAALHERLARLLWRSGDGEASLEASREAVALMPAEPSAERAQILAGEARSLMLGGRYEEARSRAETAVAVAGAAGARRQEGDALNTMGTCLGRLGHPDQAVVLLEQALGIAEAVGSIEDMRRAYNNLAVTLEDGMGQARRAADVALQGATRLDALGYDQGAAFLRGCAAISLTTAGSWADVDSLAAGLLAATPDEVTAWRARLASGTVAMRRGDFAAAHQHFDHARRLCSKLSDTDYRAGLGAAAAELALAEGLLAEARGIVDSSLAALGDTDAHHYVRLLASLGLRAEADRTRTVGRGSATKVGEALRRSEALIEKARSTSMAARGPAVTTNVQAAALEALCEAEWARVRGEPDAGQWGLVAEAWGGSYPYEAAYARRRVAEAHLVAGAKDEAVAALGEAFSEASRLGAAPLVSEIEALARRARVRLGTTTEDAQTASEGPAGLTRREVEVLALVAAGHTNRQIAEALFMSEKTASVHVSRILTKLGVTNRGQAAALAHRLKLDGTAMAVSPQS